MKKATLLLTLFAMLVTGSAVTAAPPSQTPDGEVYVVQPGDWLMKIAKNFYGDASAYRVIVEATNAKAAEDASFAVIDNPSLIRVGQKLWIPAQVQPVAAESELTLEALKNAVYQGIYDEPVQLTDGKYEGEPFVPGGASRPTVVLHPEVYAFGDLNGDGVDDAAVILIENSGGSGNFRYLAAVINEGGAPVNVATHFVGDREQMQAIRIDGNEITVDMVSHGPDDPMCCPTQEATKVYQLEDDQLVEVLVALEGTLWTLVSYGDPSDPQAVLEGSEITAEFDSAEGRVHGSAGCNSYFGAYEVDGDRLTVGPVGSTEMWCAAPENVMDQESVYLAALQDAASYKIEDGQLHITSDDGATVLTFGVMETTPLTGTTWQLIAYLDGDAFTSVLADTEITAVFGDDGQLTGSAGCNNYFGSYEVDGDAITFGPLGSTLMACPEPEGVMNQEQAYLAALGSAVTYRIEGDELKLIDADGTRVAQFVALPPASLAGTEWMLTAYNNGQEAVVSVLIGTEITAATGDDGRLTGSAGCNTYGASYEVDGDSITLGPAVTTRMWCPEPEGVMDQENAFLAALGSAATFRIQGDKLEMRTTDGALALQFTAVSEAAPTEPAAGEAYIVQPGDWLTKIAREFYGDAAAYRVIVEATNAEAAEDASFAVINNPSLIQMGQKLWIPAQPGSLTLAALQNASYQGIYDEPVQLTDGRYEGEPFVPGGASRPTVVLHPEVYAFGDLNGDGVDDAAVILIESSGGSGNFRYLAAVINEGGVPVNVATAFVGDREQVQAISIDGNEITVDMVAHGPDDPMCCPTQEVTKRYQLQGDQLIELFEFAYDFENDVEGWLVGFADLPTDYDEDIFELDSGHREIPSGLEGGGIYIQGHNRSDDLFMFLKRRVDGLKPETSYQMTFMIDLATNVPAGLVGIGGSPGESVFVKAGATTIEPLAEEDASGYLRMNIDKGNQDSEGKDMINLGDIAHLELGESTGEEYKIKTLSSDGRSFEVVTDADGGLWFIVGTDSGFEGLTVLYYSQISIVLVEAD